MATVATLVGTIVTLEVPTDVENDSNPAVAGTVDVHVLSAPGVSPVILNAPVTTAILATLASGPCTITITQP